MNLIKPDAKALLWLAIGFFILPALVSTVSGLLNRGE